VQVRVAVTTDGAVFEPGSPHPTGSLHLIESSRPMHLVRVALDVPVPTLFDYSVQEPDSDLLGARVAVPFGRGRRAGVILEVGGAPQVTAARIKPVSAVFSDEPRLAGDVLQLVEFASRYYRFPIGQVAMAALPQQLRRVSAARAEEPRLALTEAALASDWSTLPARAINQRRVLEYLRNNAAAAIAILRALSPGAGRAVRDLLERGWLAPATGIRVAVDAVVPAPAPVLTADQQGAVQAVDATADQFASWLLLGVTGSGKTEVYLQLIARALQRGRQTLLLVPEINLTPQLEARVIQRFPGMPIASLHSNVPEAERLKRWRAAESGQARVVIGTRLAVFTPMPHLGLIVVDEEQDASLKQQDGLRYSARDLAVFRAKQRNVPVVLGSATPSLESFANAATGRYRLLELPVRAASQLPVIRCVETRGQRLRDGLSQTLIEALGRRLEAREQSLVFVNRRGYAPALICFACGWSAPCTRCSARLVLHVQHTALRCHYCGHEEGVPHACPSCGNVDLSPAGHGTQRIEQALSELFPQARVLRVDRDSTRRRAAFQRMRESVHDNAVDILVGTQMLAKGHDFPRITLVGVINADSALYSSDFRAAERLFALLTQVAGRAGRAELGGEVLIQTDFPRHPLYVAVCRQSYNEFAQQALDERRELSFPPYTHHVVLRAEALKRELVDEFLGAAARAAHSLQSTVEIYEPVPAPIARVAGRERGHLLVQAATREALQRFLDAWEPAIAQAQPGQVRWTLDVDPLDL
jgi:primosomal protein N' (replication factor Y)